MNRPALTAILLLLSCGALAQQTEQQKYDEAMRQVRQTSQMLMQAESQPMIIHDNYTVYAMCEAKRHHRNWVWKMLHRDHC